MVVGLRWRWWSVAVELSGFLYTFFPQCDPGRSGQLSRVRRGLEILALRQALRQALICSLGQWAELSRALTQGKCHGQCSI